MELEREIHKELTENPVLEESVETVHAEEIQESDPQDSNKQDELQWENYLENQQKTKEQRSSHGNEEIMNYESLIANKETLYDYLVWQLNLSGLSEKKRALAMIIVESINDDGYLKTSLESLASDGEIEVSELEEVLALVQELDPPGVGARDLKECLLIQAKHLQEDTHDLVHLIENHMRNLEKKNYPEIAKTMNVSIEEVIDMCQIINGMDPKPGRCFVSNETYYVTPDVYVKKVGEKYVVSINEDGLPRLHISNFYKDMLNKKEQDQPSGKDKKSENDAQDYIQDKLRSALWLIRSIHQRHRTIYKVAESIVKRQHEFFEKGAAFIQPMILRDVADDIQMHESTVSRVTTSKYMHTPQGIFELKYFFNSAISKVDGGALANESVKLKVKRLVANEDPKNPLSDQKLVDLLKEDGIEIARRTVAKYREVLRILPSGKRKKYF